MAVLSSRRSQMKPGPEGAVRRHVTDGLLLFILVFVTFAVSVNAFWATDHATSLTQLDYALFSQRSVALGHASSVPPWSVDDFHYGGQNYSALAPGTAFFALPFAALAFTLAGGYTAYGPVLLLTETFVSLAGALAAYVVYKICDLYFRRSTSIFVGLAFAFSTVCWPFATYFFQSDVSALFVLSAIYFAIRANRTDNGNLLLIASGLAVGAAFTVDYVNAIITPILLGFILIRKGRKWRATLASAGALLLGALPGAAAIALYNHAIFGNPFMTTEGAYLGRSLLGEFSTPLLYGLSLNLVSLSRGVFAFAPFAVLGVLGFVDGIRSKGARREMLLMLAVFLGVLLPYSAWYDPQGGLSFGPRFLVAGIPFLLVPSGYIIEQVRGRREVLIYGVYGVGALINGMAAFVTAVPPLTNFDVSPFLTYVVPNFVKGNFDSLWASYVGSSLAVGALLVAVVGIALPISWIVRVRRRELKSIEAPKPRPAPGIARASTGSGLVSHGVLTTPESPRPSGDTPRATAGFEKFSLREGLTDQPKSEQLDRALRP